MTAQKAQVRGAKVAQRFTALRRAADWDPGASRPILAMLRADGRVTVALDQALAPAGLSLPRFNVLMELAASWPDGLPLHELGRRLVKSPPNMTALVDGLESERLARRTRIRADRRVVVAQITERGWEVLAAATPGLFAAEKRIVGGLSPAEREAVAGLLDRLRS